MKPRERAKEEKHSLDIDCGQTDCPTCVREAKEEAEETAKKELLIIGYQVRIETMQKWMSQDADIIQQLNESNQKLSKKIAQLEKEKNALTEKLSASYDHVCASYCDACKSPANRKA